MSAAIVAAGIPVLPFDAAIPDLALGSFAELVSFDEVLHSWRREIEAEELKDYVVDYRTFSMRPEDGALVRKGALAYTRHGSSQLIGLLLKEKPNNLNNVVRWIKPAQRAAVFNVDIRDRSKRDPADLVVLRTCLLNQRGFAARAIRAAVSTRHSLSYLDDQALSKALEAEIPADAPATCRRGVDITYGYAAVGEKQEHLIRTLNWRNSETGCASLSFSAGAIIRVVDSPVLIGGSDEEVSTTDLTVDVGSAADGARVRHTAPGSKSGNEERKTRIANDRMRRGIRKALASSELLGEAWKKALESFGPAETPQETSPELRATHWMILLDSVEEHRPLEGDREALLEIILNDKRLASIPQASAAHFAAAFAVLAKNAKTADEAVRLQTIAGRWLLAGWIKR